MLNDLNAAPEPIPNPPFLLRRPAQIDVRLIGFPHKFEADIQPPLRIVRQSLVDDAIQTIVAQTLHRRIGSLAARTAQDADGTLVPVGLLQGSDGGGDEGLAGVDIVVALVAGVVEGAAVVLV